VPWETVTENKIVNFSGMPKALPNGVHLEAGTARTAHTVQQKVLCCGQAGRDGLDLSMCRKSPRLSFSLKIKSLKLTSPSGAKNSPGAPDDAQLGDQQRGGGHVHRGPSNTAGRHRQVQLSRANVLGSQFPGMAEGC
jgi:hypothetical protein